MAADDTTLVAQNDVELNGTLEVAALDVTATEGSVSLTGDVTATEVAMTAGDSIVIDGALAADDTTLVTQNDLRLNGSINTGSLYMESMQGNVVQSALGSVTASTTTTVKALGDIALGGGNDFQGRLSADGRDVTINDINALGLGVVQTGGYLRVDSRGTLDFGETKVAGDLFATSGNGNVTQRGSISTGGVASINAGSGAITLTDNRNSFPQGVIATASSFVIAGDARAGANQALEKVLASAPVGPVTGAPAIDAVLPPPLVLSAPSSVDAGAGSSGGNEASAGAAGAATGVSFELIREPARGVLSMVAVTLPAGSATAGVGFSFMLPEAVNALVSPGDTVSVRLPDGSPLPDWLIFDPDSLRFEAVAIPDGAFPIQIVVEVSGQSFLLAISERAV